MTPAAIPLKTGIYDRDDEGLELLAGVLGEALRSMELQGDAR